MNIVKFPHVILRRRRLGPRSLAHPRALPRSSSEHAAAAAGE